jgi:hypothetical protein
VTFDPASVALGKKLGVVEDPRTFHLRSLLDTAVLPTVPANWRYAHALREVPMFANDRYGCCTCASHGHRIIAQEFATRQRDIYLTESDVLAAYSAVTGFDEATGANDNGAYMLDVANYMRRTGMGHEKDGSPHTIEAFVKIDHRNHAEVKAACNIFGGVWIGVWLPNSAAPQTGPNEAWDIPAGQPLTGDFEPGSWGGHAIEGIGYNRIGVQVYTWGKEQFLTWAFWDACVDEAYAMIDEDWFRSGGTTPRGFKAEQLRSWLKELK